MEFLAGLIVVIRRELDQEAARAAQGELRT